MSSYLFGFCDFELDFAMSGIESTGEKEEEEEELGGSKKIINEDDGS